jgi:hypothetical protein
VRSALAVLLIAGGARLEAQAQARPEFRLDAAQSGSGRAAEAGAGISIRFGPYLRGGLGASYDVWRDAGDVHRVRVESAVRFLLDPLAQQRWGLSLGAGLGVRERGYMLVVADLEGPSRGGVRPALQVALGGGTRVGVVLRRTRAGWR